MMLEADQLTSFGAAGCLDKRLRFSLKRFALEREECHRFGFWRLQPELRCVPVPWAIFEAAVKAGCVEHVAMRKPTQYGVVKGLLANSDYTDDKLQLRPLGTRLLNEVQARNWMCERGLALRGAVRRGRWHHLPFEGEFSFASGLALRELLDGEELEEPLPWHAGDRAELPAPALSSSRWARFTQRRAR